MNASTSDIRLLDEISCDISVIIVSYNTCEMTMNCVQSVLNNSDGLNIEIIVVDNCSSDGSSEALNSNFDNITIIDSPANAGFAYGNNIGFEQAKGRYILLLNPDTQVYDGGLSRAIAMMEANPKTAIMGPRVRLEDGTQQSSMIRFLRLTQLFFIIFMPSYWMRKTSLFGDLRYAKLSRDETNIVEAVSGCFMFVRRTAMAQVGGLDMRFFMYGEETEWCHRMRQANWNVVYNPDIEILHYGAASTAHIGEWKAVEMTKGHILFLRFTRGPVVAWIGTLLMALRDIVRFPYYAFKSIFNGIRWTQAAQPWRARLKFELKALINPPTGQTVHLPDPEKFRS